VKHAAGADLRQRDRATRRGGQRKTSCVIPQDGSSGWALRTADLNLARGPRRVDAVGEIQREDVKPERHRLDSGASELRGGVERQQVGELALGLGDDKPLSAAAPRNALST
jgi:hypothetical protein